jgi:hypothetical protein
MTRYDRLAQYITLTGVKIIERKRGKVSFCLPGRIYISKVHRRSFTTLSHEYIHIRQYRRYGVLGFFARYFFPQIIAIIPLITGLVFLYLGAHILALVSLGALILCLLPWPSPTRQAIELEAFRTAEANLSYIEQVAKALCSLGYWFCSWSRNKTLDKLITK